MATYLLRVELPDRPGALGAVASRIGAVRADVIAVDIVGRGRGRAIDEFVVELADDDHVPLLLSEISEVDGISIDVFRSLPDGYRDGRLDAYDTAVAMLRERSPQGALHTLASRTRRELDSAWAVVLDSEARSIIASAGRAPAGHWLAAFVESARLAAVETEADRHVGSSVTDGDDGAGGRSDIAWVDLSAWDLVLLVGSPTGSLGRFHRLRLAALARVADARWADLAERDARLSHPSQFTDLATQTPHHQVPPHQAPATSP
ncbi:MAG TPA: ACT domain-containing protein [Acidimicrobiales bacterium]|nr:ACT domain-containing protein [Acidimicrobiales bacterium]